MYYVIDTTVKPQKTVLCGNYNEILQRLSEISLRAFGQPRKERMILMESIGMGSDDNQGVNFIRSMQEIFNIGVVREDRLIRCDIVNTEFFKQEEFGH